MLSRLFALLVIVGTQALWAEDSHPNVLFILVDDFGPRDLSCYGSEVYDTPNMDRLAATGARFTQAYVAYPRCVPSRFAILTGKHPAEYQKDRDSVHIEPDRDVTIGQAFQDAGYNTFYCGKWHLGEGHSTPDNVGFDVTVAAGAAGAARSHFAPYNVSRQKGHGEKHGIEGLDDAPEGEYLTDRLTAETIDFIKANRDQPFFAMLAHYAVHTPIEAKPHLTKRYQEKIDGFNFPDEQYEPESASENLLYQSNATYAAMIQSVDNGVGRLLNLLDRLELADNTIVVLASDHGGLSARGGKRQVATSNRPFRAGKGHLYEGGLRIPLIVRWPARIAAARTIDNPVITMDLFPTLLELSGQELRPDAHRDGVSFAGLLLDSEATTDAERTFVWHNPAPRPSSTGDQFSSAIRQGKWKLVEFPTLNRVELYDLDKDREEKTDLAEQAPDRRDRLLSQLRDWKNSVGAKDAPRLRKKEQN